MYFLIGLVFSLILIYIASCYEKKEKIAFIAESAPNEKQKEIDIFWQQYKTAKKQGSAAKQEVIDSQAEYWRHRKRKWCFAVAGIFLMIIGIVIQAITWARITD